MTAVHAGKLAPGGSLTTEFSTTVGTLGCICHISAGGEWLKASQLSVETRKPS